MKPAAYQVTPASAAHIPYLAAHLRASDRREVWASHRHTPEEALRTSLCRSELAWTCFLAGQPALMWGVAPAGTLLGDTGAPWLLGSDAVAQVTRDFLRYSRVYIGLMLDRFPRLENRVHGANRPSLRWLRWCGFVVDETPEILNGETFYRFYFFQSTPPLKRSDKPSVTAPRENAHV